MVAAALQVQDSVADVAVRRWLREQPFPGQCDIDTTPARGSHGDFASLRVDDDPMHRAIDHFVTRFCLVGRACAPFGVRISDGGWTCGDGKGKESERKEFDGAPVSPFLLRA